MKKRAIAFLNPPGANREAHVSWDISQSGEYSYGHFAISDCSRKVSLELGLGPDERKSSIYKLNVLITQAQACRDALLA